MKALRIRQKEAARALGVSRCKACGEPVKIVPGLTNRELAARKLGFCRLECQERDEDE